MVNSNPLGSLAAAGGALVAPVGIARRAVEPRAIGQGRKGAPEMARGVALEVTLAAKPRPTGEDGEGHDLAFGEGGHGAGLPVWPMGVAQVVHHDLKCDEEGVHIELKSSVPFPKTSDA